MLEGRIIDRESLIDLLTVKDVKSAEDVGDFVSALKVLRDWQQEEVSSGAWNETARWILMKTIEQPSAVRRQSTCLRTIWRRLYLVDE